jgi:RNA polymerase sigma-70 factor (ECF subfamily)
MKQHRHPMVAAEPVNKPFLTEISDEMLIALIAAHDRGAMGALFLRHKVRVFRFLARIVGDAARAEDLTSEVFIEVWRRAGQFQARSKVSTWILAIAHYKAASERRRKSCAQLDDSSIASIPDPLDDPEVAAQKSNCGAILRDCLKQLSPPHREIIDLIYYHGQSIPDVAKIVGVPENTVKTRAYYARKHIAQLMAARGVERAYL